MKGQKYPTGDQLKQELDKKQLKHLYLFMGEEEGEKDKRANDIIDMVFGDSPDRKNCIGRYHLDQNEFMEAADFVLSQSIFYPTRMCILNDINTLQNNQQNKNLLEEMLTTASSSMVIIMTTPQNTPPALFSKENLNIMSIVQFWKHFDRDIQRYITMNIKKHGLTVDNNALSLLIELTGNDIRKVDDAIDILRDSTLSSTIDMDTVKNAIHDTSDVTIFQYIDALFCNSKKSLNLMNKLLNENTPELLILNMVLRQADTIEKYFTLTDSGSTVDDALKQCGIFQRKKDIFWDMTRKFPREKIKKVFPLIARADYELKSGSKGKSLMSNPIFNLTAAILEIV